MKIKYFIFLILFLFSCKEKKKNTEIRPTEISVSDSLVTTQQALSFTKANGKAILLGKNMKLLDENFEEIKDISYLNEVVVDFTEYSNEFVPDKKSNDYCQDFQYVKIKNEDWEGYVDGRNVYELIEHEQNTSFEIDNHKIQLIATRHFGIGVSDENGLTFCSINTPMVLVDEKEGYYGIVLMKQNDLYENPYPYFELWDNDMGHDEVVDLEKINNLYLLKLKRFYQEGENVLTFSIFKDELGLYYAELIEVIAIE
jgi:hypothetical protein